MSTDSQEKGEGEKKMPNVFFHLLYPFVSDIKVISLSLFFFSVLKIFHFALYQSDSWHRDFMTTTKK